MVGRVTPLISPGATGVSVTGAVGAETPVIGGGGGSTSGDVDFQRRIASPGVFQWFTFNDSTQLGQNAAQIADWHTQLAAFSPATAGLGVGPTIDTTTFASGTGSLRFQHLSASSEGAAGTWQCRFSPNNASPVDNLTQFAADFAGNPYSPLGKSLFLQVRVRYNQAFCNTFIYNNDTWGSTFGATYVNANTFTVTGDQTAQFPLTTKGVRTYNSANTSRPFTTWAFGKVQSATYNSGTNLTTIVLDTSNGTDPSANIPLSPSLDTAQVGQFSASQAQGGAKIFDVGTGYNTDLTSNYFNYYSGNDAPSSSRTKLVVQNFGQSHCPHIYNGDNGSSFVGGPTGKNAGLYETFGTDVKVENAMPSPFCLRSVNSAGDFPITRPGCFTILPDQWMTFQLGVDILNRRSDGGQDAWDARVRLWGAYEGQPSQLLIDFNTSTPGYFPIAAGPLAALEKIGKATLFPFMTAKDQHQQHAPLTVWYDELILSTQQIPDPQSVSYPSWRTNINGVSLVKDTFYEVPHTGINDPLNADLKSTAVPDTSSLTNIQMLFPVDDDNSTTYLAISGGHTTSRGLDGYNPVASMDWRLNQPAWNVIDRGTADVTRMQDQWHMQRVIDSVDSGGSPGTLQFVTQTGIVLSSHALSRPCGTVVAGAGFNGTDGVVLNAVASATATKTGTIGSGASAGGGGRLLNSAGAVICDTLKVGLAGSGADIIVNTMNLTAGVTTVTVASATAPHGYIDEFYVDGRLQACHPYYHPHFVGPGKMADGKARLMVYGNYAGYAINLLPHSWYQGPQTHSFVIDPAFWTDHAGLDGVTYHHGWEPSGTNPDRLFFNGSSPFASIARHPVTHDMYLLSFGNSTPLTFYKWTALTNTYTKILDRSQNNQLGGTTNTWTGAYPSFIDTKRNLFVLLWTENQAPTLGHLLTASLDGTVITQTSLTPEHTFVYGGGCYDEFNDRYLFITATSTSAGFPAQMWNIDPTTRAMTKLCQTVLPMGDSSSSGNNANKLCYLPNMKCLVYLTRWDQNWQVMPLVTV